MSQENVDFIRNLFAGTASMDKQALLAALPDLIPQVADPAIEWIEDPTRADSRVYRGHEGVLASWKQWLEQWHEYDWEIDRLVDCGENVFVVAHERGTGASSGAVVSSHLYLVVTVRNQKITHWREFYDENAAVGAAGLWE
jgi:ketosteroid isomerase-like protein